MGESPEVSIALLGVVTTIITTISGTIIALMNSKRERIAAAEEAADEIMRGRLALRDEQIADLKQDKEELIYKIQELRRELEMIKNGGVHDR